MSRIDAPRPPVQSGSRGRGAVRGPAAGDDGFTLVELMLVLMILAILLAIAVPTFLGTTGTADTRSAQANLASALTALKTQATQRGQTYTGLTTTIMTTNEPSLSWSESTTTTPTGVSTQGPIDFYVSSDGNGIVVISYSDVTDSCWWAVDNLQTVTDTVGPYGSSGQATGGGPTQAPTRAGTYYGESTPPASGTCNPAITPTLANWAGSFSAVA
jgi:type IV pilus assembly protein PilA